MNSAPASHKRREHQRCRMRSSRSQPVFPSSSDTLHHVSSGYTTRNSVVRRRRRRRRRSYLSLWPVPLWVMFGVHAANLRRYLPVALLVLLCMAKGAFRYLKIVLIGIVMVVHSEILSSCTSASTRQLISVCAALVSVVGGAAGVELSGTTLYGGLFQSSSTIAYAEVRRRVLGLGLRMQHRQQRTQNVALFAASASEVACSRSSVLARGVGVGRRY